MFRLCRETGINFFDCANIYAAGRSEEILGRLIRDCRDELVITSKVYFPDGAGRQRARALRAAISCTRSKPASEALGHRPHRRLFHPSL